MLIDLPGFYQFTLSVSLVFLRDERLSFSVIFRGYGCWLAAIAPLPPFLGADRCNPNPWNQRFRPRGLSGIILWVENPKIITFY